MAEYICRKCGFKEPVQRWLWRCPVCGGPLDVEGDVIKPFSLGEGGTPCITSERLGSGVMFKLEYLNPTGSFKDRGTALAVAYARSLGIKCLAEDSSGNAGISMTAYSIAAGIRPIIAVPSGSGSGKRNLMSALGATIYEESTRDAARRRAMELDGKGCAYAGHMYSPFFIRGMEGIVSELASCGDFDSVITPVASGTLFLGLYKGLRGTGKRLFAAQAAGAASLYEALHGKAPAGTSSLADALLVRNPPRLSQMVEAIKEAGGDAVPINDEEILGALRDLYRTGLIVEPSSAASLAAYKKLKDDGTIRNGEKAVIVLTGSGLKYHSELVELLKRSVY